MTHEEKLDFILGQFKNRKLPYDNKLQEPALYDFIEGKFPLNEALHLISKLLRDEYILIDSTGIPMLVLTIDGHTFLRDGGYVGERQRKKELLENSKQNLAIAKKNTNWVIVGALAAIAAVIVGLISLFMS